jgi:hypothetical protein
MEVMQRRTSIAGDISDAESEEIEFEEIIVEDAADKLFLKAVMKLGDIANVDVPM